MLFEDIRYFRYKLVKKESHWYKRCGVKKLMTDISPVTVNISKPLVDYSLM